MKVFQSQAFVGDLWHFSQFFLIFVAVFTFFKMYSFSNKSSYEGSRGIRTQDFLATVLTTVTQNMTNLY